MIEAACEPWERLPAPSEHQRRASAGPRLKRSGPFVAQPLLILEPVPTSPDARCPLQYLLHGRPRGTLFLRSKVANGLTYKLRHWHAEARGLPVQPSLALVVQVDHCSGHFFERDIAFRPRRYQDRMRIGKLGVQAGSSSEDAGEDTRAPSWTHTDVSTKYMALSLQPLATPCDRSPDRGGRSHRVLSG